MDLRLIKRIIKMVEDSNINELEVEEGDLRISVCKQGPTTYCSPGQAVASPQPFPGEIVTGPPNPQSMSAKEETGQKSESEESKGRESGVIIPSPMVGTFYRAPSPDDPAYVQVGSVVEPDTVVCILEAMKVMNEIKAGVSGKVVEILAENGNPVEFGQPLFRVEP